MVTRYVYFKNGTLPERGADITWDELLTQFLRAKRRQQRTDKYVYDLKNSLGRSAKWFEGEGITPCKVNKKNTVTFLEVYKDTGVGDRSVFHMASKLMSLYTFAYQEEIFDSNKLATMKKPEIRDRKKHNAVTLDEIGAVRDQIRLDWSPEHAPASRFRSEEARAFFSERDTCMTLWMPETGARIGETCKVLRGDLDLDARTALLRGTKNGDDRLIFYTKEFRDGPLAEWLAIRDGMETLTDYLFVSERGLQLNPGTWGRQWDRYRQRAGIERRIRRHDLRHFASTAHDRVDKDLSKKIIGHHTDSAHAIYSHREVAELRVAHDAANPIGPILAKAEARQADSEPKTVRRKIYTKVTRGQG